MGLFENKIKQFPKIFDWVERQDVSRLSSFLLDNDRCNRLFVASGGSFSAAVYAEQLSADKGIMSHALTPLLYARSGFAHVAARALLISASGYNNDILRAYDNGCRAEEQDMGAVVLTSKGRLQTLMQENDANSLFGFDIPTGRDGFLSSTTVVAFYTLLYRAFGHTELSSVSTDLSAKEQEEINCFVDRLKRISLDELTEHEAFLHKLEGVDSFLFYIQLKVFLLPLILSRNSQKVHWATHNLLTIVTLPMDVLIGSLNVLDKQV